jgi:hypothetical protein
VQTAKCNDNQSKLALKGLGDRGIKTDSFHYFTSGYETGISYYDLSNGALKYASNGISGSKGAWATEIVDNAGNVGGFTSTVLHSSNRPHISYYDNTNHDLKYAVGC